MTGDNDNEPFPCCNRYAYSERSRVNPRVHLSGKIHCIYSATVWRHEPGADHVSDTAKEVDNELYALARMTRKVGDIVTHDVAAPGTGRVAYRITRIDDQGVWGYLVLRNVRILDPGDVR